MKDEIRRTLESIAREQSTQGVAFEVRRNLPRDFSSRGEYSSNIAHVLAAKIRDGSEVTAQGVIRSWPHRAIIIEAEKGFLNFRMSDETLNQLVGQAIEQGREYGASRALAGRRVNVEFVSADPVGPLSLQHGRIAATGDALCRLLEFGGAQVTREYFINDVETSSKLQLLGESVAALYLEHFGQSSSPEGALRDRFTRSIAQDLVTRKGNSLLLLPDDERARLSTHEACEAVVAQHKQTLKKFGTYFDVWTSEDNLRNDRLVESVLEQLKAAGHTYEKDGTLWLQSTAFGDEADRPLQRKNGEYTYLAADIAYHSYLFDRDFELLVNIWTAEHRQYVARTHAALRAAGFDAARLEVLVCEDVTLLRDGEAMEIEGDEPSLEDALEEIEAENLRFWFLLSDPDESATIEAETASRDDESNPAYAARLLPARLSTLLGQTEHRTSNEERQLTRFVALWPDEVESALQERKPQRIARFVQEMSEAVRDLLKASRPETNPSPEVLRAALVVSQNALRILGIEPRTKF